MSWSRFSTFKKDCVFSAVVHDVHLSVCSGIIQFRVTYTIVCRHV